MTPPPALPRGRWAPRALEVLLLVHRPDRLRRGLKPAPRDGFPALVREAVGALLDLRQSPLHVFQAPPGLVADGRVHLPREHLLTHVARVVLRHVALGLAAVLYVSLHATLDAR